MQVHIQFLSMQAMDFSFRFQQIIILHFTIHICTLYRVGEYSTGFNMLSMVLTENQVLWNVTTCRKANSHRRFREAFSASKFQCQATLKHRTHFTDTAFHHIRHEYSSDKILLSYLVLNVNCKSFGISKLFKYWLVNNYHFLCYNDRQEGGICNVVYYMPIAGHRILLY